MNGHGAVPHASAFGPSMQQTIQSGILPPPPPGGGGPGGGGPGGGGLTPLIGGSTIHPGLSG
mgnify:CR=1 FL=1